VGLESARLPLLGAAAERALVLGFWGDDDVEAWGGCGADLVLVRVFESCEDTLGCVDSGLEDVRLRVREGGRDGATGGLSVIGWDTSTGVALSATC
jgi:hypothetical protein